MQDLGRRAWRFREGAWVEIGPVQALATGGAPAASDVRLRGVGGVFYGRVLTLAGGLCASAPVIAAAVRALNEGWQPIADRGIIATRAFDVFSSHTPLIGQYSFASKVTGELTYSLGPMLYWLLAPAAHVGAPGTFVITMAVFNVACVLIAVALARRRGGVWLMVAAAVGIGLMCRSIAANNFYDIWNPSAGLFPLLALIFLCWSLACGEYRLAPVTALLGSFLLQCEAGFIPPSLAALAVGLGGLAIWWVRATRAGPRPRVWPWGVAALVVLAACWSAPLIDQIGHSGNIGHVITAAKDRKSPYGAKVGARAVVRTVGVTPWWLIRPANPFERKFDVRRSAGTLANVSTALILGWLLLAAAPALPRRRADVAAGAVLALLLSASVWSIASATPSTPRFLSETLGFTMWSATTVGMFVWLVAGWAAVALSGARSRNSRAAGSPGGRPRPRTGSPHARRRAARLSPRAVHGLGLAAGASR